MDVKPRVVAAAGCALLLVVGGSANARSANAAGTLALSDVNGRSRNARSVRKVARW